MGETPFFLAYGTEAIISVNVCMPSLRMKGVEWDQTPLNSG